MGAVVAAAELLVVFLKVNLLAYVPLFFFAATLIFIGFDLMAEWLVDVRQKLDPMEYGVSSFNKMRALKATHRSRMATSNGLLRLIALLSFLDC